MRWFRRKKPDAAEQARTEQDAPATSEPATPAPAPETVIEEAVIEPDDTARDVRVVVVSLGRPVAAYVPDLLECHISRIPAPAGPTH